MIRLKYWIKDFFGFSRSQVNGFIILLPLVAVFIFSEPVWHWWMRNRRLDFTSDKVKLDSLVALWSITEDKTSLPDELPHQKPVTFAFDPNYASDSAFMALGLPDNVASRIVRYREKGGKFRIKSDLLKIYGIDSTFYHKIHAYIRLPELYESSKRIKKVQKKERVANTTKELEKFDLNKADTTQLKKIYGIGEKLSLRIIKYRDVLGGFVGMNQLKEVYGLDSTVVNRLTQASYLETDFHPTLININTATEKTLSAHPYLSKVARAIVAYRFQHGEFKALEDIRNIGSLDEKTVQKIIPYLKLGDE